MQPDQLLGGRYRLTERIGAGGMGEVWRAEDATLERTVAIKALHPAMADDADFRERFLREARTVAALNVPGVVAMFDSGEETTADGSVLSYLVMEFVVGRPLSDYVSSSDSLPPDEVMRLVAQVAQGLDAAHRAGIIHRDVKSTNILVNRNGDASLVDFGIARRHGDTGLTTTGAVMGTVEYASPEQLRDEDLTPMSDVYSLGVVAYECLSGARPFDGQSVGAVVAGHLNRTPPSLPETVPTPITRVVMRALAKDPRDRYPTAAEFVRACREAVAAVASPRTQPMPSGPAAERPVVARTHEQPTAAAVPDAAPRRGEPRKQRRGRGLAVISGIAVLAVLATIGVMMFTMDSPANSAHDGPSDDPKTSGESPSDKPGPKKPETSALVSADNTLCLLPEALNNAASSIRAPMGLCENSEFPEHTFDSAGGGIVTIEFTAEYEDGRSTTCLAMRSAGEGLLGDPDCDPLTAWKFTHLRTEDGVDYWRIRSVADTKLCLTAGAASGDDASVKPCDDSASQQWRTDAAA